MTFVELFGLKNTAENSVLEKVIIIFLILFITWLTAVIIRAVMEKSYRKTKHILNIDKTAHTFIKHFLTGAIYIIGISIAIYTIPSLRTLSVSIFAGAGVLAVIIGFASQAAFSNIVSGIFISIFKPFRVGDRISLQTVSGFVEDINLRHTTIRTYENIRYVIPNSKISEETIENKDLGEEKIRKFLEFSVSYESDLSKAMKIIEEEAKKHPDFMENPPDDLFREGPNSRMIRVIELGDSGIKIRARVWTKDAAAAFRLISDMNVTIVKRFREEGIEIPYPQRVITYKTNLAEKRLVSRAPRKVLSKKSGMTTRRRNL